MPRTSAKFQWELGGAHPLTPKTGTYFFGAANKRECPEELCD